MSCCKGFNSRGSVFLLQWLSPTIELLARLSPYAEAVHKVVNSVFRSAVAVYECFVS